MHDHEINSLSTQLNNTTQNGGFVDIWGKSAGSEWRRCGQDVRNAEIKRTGRLGLKKGLFTAQSVEHRLRRGHGKNKWRDWRR